MGVQIHRLLAGEDGPGQRALPAGELLHPLTLAAVVVLVVNDHLLKGSGAVPSAITGKLSDVAGLAFFPLLVTALVDLGLLAGARLGLIRADFSLNRRKLGAAITATAALFTAIKLSAPAAAAVADALTAIGIHSRIVADPSDLLALPALAIAAAIGLAEIDRVPLGRIELVERRFRAGLDPAVGLADLTRRRVGRPDPARIAAVRTLGDALTGYFTTGDRTGATEALRFFRAARGSRRRRPGARPSGRTRTSRRTDG